MFKLIAILLLGLGVFTYSILDKAKQYEKHYKQIAIPYEIDTNGVKTDYLDTVQHEIQPSIRFK
jgi:hypothetical protein